MDYELLNQQIDNMLEFANQIGIKYKELKTLELSGLKNTNLYKNVCVGLKNNILKESSFYKKLNYTEEEIEYLIDFICDKYNIEVNQSFENMMHYNDKSFLPALRVIFKIENFIKYDYETLEEEIVEDELDKHLDYQKNLLLNYCLVLESHIKEYEIIEDNLDNILYIKYLLPFINSNIEEEFLKNFDFDKELYLNYKMLGDLSMMSDVIQNQYIHLHLYNKFVNEINTLLEIKDVEFNDCLDQIIISEIIIKSLLVFFDTNFIQDCLDDLICHITENYDYYFDKQRIIANIMNLEEITKKDKSKYRYLSLRLPRN